MQETMVGINWPGSQSEMGWSVNTQNNKDGSESQLIEQNHVLSTHTQVKGVGHPTKGHNITTIPLAMTVQYLAI